MEDIIDLIATDSKPSEISLTIKNTLFSKAAEKIDSLKPSVASYVFGDDQEEDPSSEEE
jgi:tRNA(His) 5'-end guanylyltransferase